jgi:glycosyltransferase involved in cell wall biosynthesis
MTTRQPPLLIGLPHGLNVSGVTMWAVRLANALAAGTGAKGDSAANEVSGVGLVVHREPVGHEPLSLEVHPDVMMFDARHLPPLEEAHGNLEPFASVYRDAVRAMVGRFGSPAVLSPNLHGDCYGVAAQLSQTEPIRVVAWHHSDIEYNTRVFAHYEGVIARFVAVSERIGEVLCHRILARAEDVVPIPYGVSVPEEPPVRGADHIGDRPVRLIYTGRIEQEQKRVGVLVLLSDELERRGIDHHLTMVGDGPAADEIDTMIASRSERIRRLPPVTPDRVNELLDQHDMFVLSSRYEGLSVSMLEAIARGCVPVVTRVNSGASQVIEEGVNGVITQAGSNESERTVAESLADAVAKALSIGLEKMSHSAWQTALSRFSIENHASSVRAMLQSVEQEPLRRWPEEKPCAFTQPRAQVGVSSGSVPADGVERMQRTLGALAGRPVVIYGAGEHTRQLAHIIEASPIRLVAIADDDPGKHGTQMLGVPVISLAQIADSGARDVVISSWMHEGAMHDGVASCVGEVASVHRLYL